MDALRVLVVEDSEDDLLLLVRRLRAERFDPTFRRVDNEADLRAALADGAWDLLITDYVLPGFGGLEAIAIVRAEAPDLPCIVVSGQIGEATAVEAMRAGAADYIMKDNLGRLGPAIRRELEEARTRKERRRVAAALAEERERHAITLRSIADGVVATDIAGRITLMNRVAETLCGWSIREANGRSLAEVFETLDEKTRTPIGDPVPQVLASGRNADAGARYVLVARDGTERIVAVTASSIRDRESRTIGTVFVYHDATERSRLERELLRAQKLESVGILAGGIAHDFNNILTGVLGNVSLSRAMTTPADPINERLVEAEKALVRARDLTLQLLTFARGGMPIKKTSSIRELIVDSASFVLRGSRARCEFFIPDDLRPVEVDPGQISQVIQNLVLNADQAMPTGGTITVSAANVPATGGGPDHVRITVKDQGVGIPQAHLDRIFDPYFTTKPGGTGLGLATSYSIVRNHGGSISVESRPGDGATFHVLLPAAKGGPAPTAAPEGEALRGRGRVLVMDDEPLVRSVAEQMLRHLGYETATAADGQEAVDLYAAARGRGERFDVVVVDLTVPAGLGGVETAALLRRLDPEARIIVSSGYSSDPIMSEYPRHGFCAVVSKPYTVRELGRALREALDAPLPPLKR